ncbi:primosomal replication protein N [Nitrosomonas sp. ANs5]|uniref:primosomal replication protein N n=1 Tax=Nitrosomonas sp. ANs5 TaxID=3423941 RepID=UPI003D3577F1
MLPSKFNLHPEPGSTLDCNQVIICGKIVKLATPRYTPAGIMVTELKLSHESMQVEAGSRRQVTCELAAIAMADLAEQVYSMGIDRHVRLTGFLVRKNRMNDQLILHICDAALA